MDRFKEAIRCAALAKVADDPEDKKLLAERAGTLINILAEQYIQDPDFLAGEDDSYDNPIYPEDLDPEAYDPDDMQNIEAYVVPDEEIYAPRGTRGVRPSRSRRYASLPRSVRGEEDEEDIVVIEDEGEDQETIDTEVSDEADKETEEGEGEGEGEGEEEPTEEGEGEGEDEATIETEVEEGADETTEEEEPTEEEGEGEGEEEPTGNEEEEEEEEEGGEAEASYIPQIAKRRAMAAANRLAAAGSGEIAKSIMERVVGKY